MSSDIQQQINVEKFKQQVLELTAAVDAALPGASTMLAKIHLECIQTPELVQILSKEDIGKLMQGMMTQTGIVILEEKEATKKRTLKKDLQKPDLLADL